MNIKGSRWLRIGPAFVAVVLAVIGVVGAISSRDTIVREARTRNLAASVRPLATREIRLLRIADQRHTRKARARFFASAQRQAAVLSSLEQASSLVVTHDAAIAAAARGNYRRAARLLSQVDVGGGGLLSMIDLASSRPWPSTVLEQFEAAAIALVLLLGAVVLMRMIRRVAGLSGVLGAGGSEIERLTHAVRSDALTGLANRRAFEDDLTKLIEERNATGKPFSMLAFDLDGLKRINDTGGHAAGDSYIRNVAETLREGVGADGTVYRTGGDEFAALLPGARGWNALTIAHDLQRSTHLAAGRRALSIGITESTKTEGRRLLIHQADLALYEAKRGQLLAVTYHAGLEPDTASGADAPPSQQQKALAAALARAVDARDAGTRNHSETVAELCVALATRLGISGVRLERLRLAGLLHDVGKIGVSDAVLAKRGALAPEERAEVEVHTSVGYAILTSAELHEEAVWVLHHHERYDGSGYPTGIAGEEIPRESRIIAVADAFEAMTGSRPYRISTTPDEALRELHRCSGTQFDPVCVEALDALFGGRGVELEPDTDDSAAASA
jgi:diguanylate cyclase (GGDEF)-like protein/putative nucleotidyltransferase with HDIG domain